jgi:hypothetical protein
MADNQVKYLLIAARKILPKTRKRLLEQQETPR